MNARLRYINFHGIGESSRMLEPGEDRYWLGIDQFRDLLDRIADHPDRDSIRITFDDGNISDLAIATPELLRRGLSAQFFVLAGRIGARGSLDRADLRDLIAAGMELGSHGTDHVDWTGLPRTTLHRELRNSIEAIGDATGIAVEAAAIPFGRYNAAVLAALDCAGFAAVYSSDAGVASPTAFLRPRTSVTADMSDGDLGRSLRGRMRTGKRMRRWVGMATRRWL